MDQLYINKDWDSAVVVELQEEVKRLKENIHQLEQQIHFIQQNCKHVFLEYDGFRKCMKCQKIDVQYY
jgi:prefoldin subunit 5